MPGPVNLHPDVMETFRSTFLSHRSEKFYSDVESLRTRLCRFVNAEQVAFLVGSGSLANETVAQYLKQLGGKGFILVGGEFGKRLTEQATHAGVDFEAIRFTPGQPFDYDLIESRLMKEQPSFVWTVHCETSTGVLNDIGRLKKIAAKGGAKLALDCISTIANIDVDLSGVYIASGTSGKGLASFAGIAMVYFKTELFDLDISGMPKYFNLAHHRSNRFVPYTINTNQFYALEHAFRTTEPQAHREQIKHLSDFIYKELIDAGLSVLGSYDHMMPGVISLVCPPAVNAFQLGTLLEENGFYVNYGGAYLRADNYFQICIMGHQTLENAKLLCDFIKEHVAVLLKSERIVA